MDNAVLARPGLAVDPANDGRHQLGGEPFARESIPYLVNLPEAGIALFTYTWVDRDSKAGAMLAIFGPGVGPEPIQVRLADRVVPLDMDFSDWTIDGFTMRQDLQFGVADIRWESPEALFELRFEAFHPPYSYGANAGGCPPYAAIDRIEQSGRATGRLTLNGREIAFDTTGHRDHSWGTRDWRAMQHYKWFEGQAGPDVSVHFWQLQALGRTELRGYVFKDGLMAEVTDVAIDWEHDNEFRQIQYDFTLQDEAGRTTSVSVDVFAHYPLIPDPALILNEGAGRALIDGMPGLGWMEVAWPADYLAHIKAAGPY